MTMQQSQKISRCDLPPEICISQNPSIYILCSQLECSGSQKLAKLLWWLYLLLWRLIAKLVLQHKKSKFLFLLITNLDVLTRGHSD